MKGALRASCVRCNAVLASDTFEQDWSFARCAKCSARSPVPETVRRARPEAFTGVPRALADVLARKPADVIASSRTDRAWLWLDARPRFSLQRVLWSAAAAMSPLPPAMGASIAASWKLSLTATTEGDRLRLQSPTGAWRLLEEPLSHEASADPIEGGLDIVIRGGHPVSEEWIAGAVLDRAHALWVAEWIAAQLRAHLAATRAGPDARGTRGYRG